MTQPDHKQHSTYYIVYVETYGCQMNVSDTEIVLSIMQKGGFEVVKQPEDADVVLLNTCAIRDNAEQKVWKRLEMINALNKES